MHRDLKPENIVATLDNDVYNWKIIDFGFSRATTASLTMQSFVGTANYVAPEILAMQPYTKSVDVWSIGVVTYVLLCGYLPFDCESSTASHDYDLVFDPQDWANVSVAAKSFVMQCLKKDPEGLGKPWGHDFGAPGRPGRSRRGGENPPRSPAAPPTRIITTP